MRGAIGILLGLALATAAQAQMYKCANERGGVQYSDKPCPGGSKGGEVDIRGQPPISGKLAPQREDLRRQEGDFQRRQQQRDREDERRLQLAAQKQKRCEALRTELQRMNAQRRPGDAAVYELRLSQLNQQMARQCS